MSGPRSKGLTCSMDECIDPVRAKGFCLFHYGRYVRKQPLDAPRRYTKERRKMAPTCSFSDCRRPSSARGLCPMHYERARRHGDANWQPPQRQPGDRTINNYGYVRVWLPDHPCADKNGQIAEHRLVMEQMIGRTLLPHENVHHLNGVRDDNRPENLELWSKSQPAGQRVADKVAWAKEILALYGEMAA